MGRELKENAVYAIWGAGRYGKAAYGYYKEHSNIAFYIDNDEKKWGSTLNGLKIYSPQILREKKANIIIALKNGQEEIGRRLEKDYGITSYTVFGVFQQDYDKENRSKQETELERDSLIVCSIGGLGNQMFQYALYRNLQNRGKNVYFDITGYDLPVRRQFLLKEVFPDISLRLCSKGQRERFWTLSYDNIAKFKDFEVYVEPGVREEKIKTKNERLFHMKSGIIYGYHQCFQYAEEVREILLRDFAFPNEKERQLAETAERIKAANSVSIHIRRGDYLGQNEEIYGGICTVQYYSKAITYIKERVENAVFYVFSNEIEWVQKHINIENAVFINSAMFENYRDWYDIYLMSICRHNIIANSTFSWWGAWLNQSEDKTVIAPLKWTNICDYQDICPRDWVRL